MKVVTMPFEKFAKKINPPKRVNHTKTTKSATQLLSEAFRMLEKKNNN